MDKSIKGITVLIGGDTTKLDDALKGVNKKSNDLSKELREVNKLLKLDPKNTVLLEQKQKLLKTAIENTAEKLGKVKEAERQAQEQFKKGEISAEQYRAIQREVESTTIDLKKYENQLDNINNADKRNAEQSESNWAIVTTGISSAINIGEKVTEVFQKAWEVGSQIGGFLGSTVKEFAGKADDFATNAKKYGIELDTLQRWEYASELVDVSTDTMGRALGKLTRSLGSYQKGSAEYVKAFDSLGVAVYDASGEFRDSEQIFYDTIDALNQLDDETQRNVIASTIFGRSFQELNPLIDSGTQSLQELGKEADDLGLIMSDEQIANLNAANDAFDRLQNQLGMALLPLAQELAPVLEKMATWIGEKLANPKTQEVLQSLGKGLAQLFEALGGKIAEMVESGEFANFIDKLVEAIPIIADRVAQMLDRLAGEDGKNVLGFLGGAVDFVESFLGGWIKVNEALTSFFNNLGQFFSGIQSSFENTVGKVFKQIQDFPENVKKTFEDIGRSISNALKGIHIPTLHYSGGFDLAKGKLPKIEWYAKGGVFNSPSVIGVGEAGPEAVVPLDKFGAIVNNAVKSARGGTYQMNVYPQSMSAAEQDTLFRKFDRFIGNQTSRASI